jgi:aryl-phospho-beta-D-glucosidase BglC (GH1 family)
LDIPDGAWDPPGQPLYSGMGHWNPHVVKEALENYHRMGFNVIRFHTVVEWWKTNPITYQDPFREVTYPETYRQMMKDTVKWAAERGLYVIFDFFAMKNIQGRQTGQETLPWTPWGKFPDVVRDPNEFISIWDSVAQELGGNSNVLFELYNEPHGDANAEQEWFRFVQAVLPVIRTRTPNPVIIQWDYNCWINLDYPPPGYPASTLDWINRHPLAASNLIYGTHLYRNSGGGAPGLAHRSKGQVVNLWQKADLNQALNLALFPQILQVNKKPILVTEIGAFLSNGKEDQQHELDWLKNTLSILNQWGVGYVAWAWQSDQQLGHGMLHEGNPNQAGEIFLDSLKGP